MVEKTLSCMHKDELVDMAREVRIPNAAKLKKSQLIEELVPQVVVPGRRMLRALGMVPIKGTLDFARKVYDAGGMIEMRKAEHDALPAAKRMISASPFLNVYEHAGKVTCVILDELMELVEPSDWEMAATKSRYLEHARKLVDVYLTQCGIISVRDLTRLYLDYYPDEYDADEFGRFLLDDGPDLDSGYDTWIYQGEPHLINYQLVGRDEGDPSAPYVDIDGDDMLVATTIEKLRRHLRERHAQLKIWEVPSKSAAELESYSLLGVLAALPSRAALQSFIDRNITDGEDDYTFADDLIDEITEIIRLECLPQEVVRTLEDWGLAFDSDEKTNVLLDLTTAYTNDIPRWSNNGWSPVEVRDRAGELRVVRAPKRAFYDESGKPRKIGRNEPCPCGSGKKYKRCCGK